ncbi:MAG: pilus assembly protein N-terminal domain-containing protein [Planctomycetota bacterium JB042]
MRSPGSRTLAALLLVVATAAAQERTEPGEVLEILEGHHARLSFGRSVDRVAVGNPDVLDDEVVVLSDREVLLLGRSTGRTTLMVWFDDGTVERRAVTVKRDYTALEAVLQRIDPDVRLAVAPDRDALVLSGRVPDQRTRLAAVRAAESYLRAGSSDEGEPPIVGEDGVMMAAGPKTRSTGSVIDLLTVERLPDPIERRVETALRAVGMGGVTVHRFLHGDLPDDERDLFVLTGQVADQSRLTRSLQIAGRLVTGGVVRAEDVRVVSDESGGLAGGEDQVGSGSDTTFGRGFGGGTSGSSLFGSVNAVGRLGNRLGVNLARAKAVSVAEGRILSFIEVSDLPQVRVDIRFYEVNRTDLLSYSPEFAVLASDFGQPSLNPAAGATAVQGNAAARVGASGDDVQNVLSFLADGFGQQTQISAGGLAIDVALRWLESRGIARNLSGPSITVLSGERALFQVGGEVPIPESFSPAFGTPGAGAGVTPGVFSSVRFRPFGVQLGVRPLVGEGDFVTVDLVTQVARPDAELTTVIRETTGADTLSTAFETRSLQTSARLADGESLVLGGLIQRRHSDDTSFAPWFESIPVLGWMFKRYSIEDEDSEVVVVVHPTVVRDPIPGVDLWTFPETGALDFTIGPATRAAPRSEDSP